jgi:sugar phosphate isomerase/epimerase
MQMYSVRALAKENVDQAFAQVHQWGIKEVELAGLYGLTAEQMRDKLAQYDLKAVGAHFGYEVLQSSLDEVIREARVLNVKYVVCPWLQHSARPFDKDYALEVAKNFNLWGLKLNEQGIKFGYHTHGFEFTPIPGGNGDTPFDVLVQNTDPKFVTFEMDVFWVWSSGADPFALLKRYPDRWSLAHLKDMRKGDARDLHGAAKVEQNVSIGDGQVPWPALLKDLGKHGVHHLLIEDETADPMKNIPTSLQYLASIGYRP